MEDGKDKCVYIGQTAMYRGPFKAVTDDDGHMFPRGKPVEICTDTAKKLSGPPFKALFIITSPTQGKGGPCCENGKPC